NPNYQYDMDELIDYKYTHRRFSEKLFQGIDYEMSEANTKPYWPMMIIPYQKCQNEDVYGIVQPEVAGFHPTFIFAFCHFVGLKNKIGQKMGHQHTKE